MDNIFLEEARQVLTAPDDRPINVGRFSHWSIAEGLWHLTHETQEWFLRNHIRLSHADGSEWQPLPILKLEPHETGFPTRAIPLRIGFVSGRHPELDHVCDFFLLRNREVGKLSDPSAGLEREIFERLWQLLIGPEIEQYEAIELHHTGLETVTVAVYRSILGASVERQKGGEGRRPLWIQPKMWRPQPWVDGAWLAKNLGLRVEELEGGETLAARYPHLVRFEQRTHSRGRVRPFWYWIANRPMRVSERDLLCQLHPDARLVIDALYDRAQYATGHSWVI